MKNSNIISTAKAPQAIGPYSQAIKVDNLIFTSGQIPISVKTNDIINNVFEKFFLNVYPARSVIEVSKLPKNSQIEIEAVCYNDN